MREKIQAVLREIRPLLQADGKDLELVGISREGVAQIRFQGACADCRDSLMSLKESVERVIRERVPEVREVVAV